MRATIDGAGRVVIPKPLREVMGFEAGQELEIEHRDGVLEIGVVQPQIRLERDQDGHLRAVADAPMPPLTPELVRETLEQIRR